MGHLGVQLVIELDDGLGVIALGQLRQLVGHGVESLGVVVDILDVRPIGVLAGIDGGDLGGAGAGEGLGGA